MAYSNLKRVPAQDRDDQTSGISDEMLISIIIPLKEISNYLRDETIPALLRQSYQNFEIIVLPDRPTKEKFAKTRIIPTWPKVGPADKRNLGAQKARGEILAFIDDDAYPDKDWLKNALSVLESQTSSERALANDQASNIKHQIAAVCGPGITPPTDPLLAQVSGWMWASFLGSGGAGQYRCWPQKRREVDDFPTFNFLVKKDDFWAVNGFNANFWPGEDTKVCYDLVYKLNKKIIYDPKILVYHHRRKILKDHLKQIGRYGLHRGYFSKILPKTSKRIGYFMPPLFAAGVILGPILYLISILLGYSILTQIITLIYLSAMGVYLLGLLLNGFWVFLKSKNILAAILVIPTIFISHVFYGLMFAVGLSRGKIQSKFSREAI